MELRNTTLDDIANVIGFSATLRLVAWYGDGNNVYVPEVVQEGQVLVRLLGEARAKKLSEEWGGEHLTVPRLHDYDVDVKRRLICRMLEQGFGTREVSTHLRMTERRVQQICRELEAQGLLQVIVTRKGVDILPQKSAQQKAVAKTSGEKTPAKNGVENAQENLGVGTFADRWTNAIRSM